jgi:hypothetical protein
MNYYFQADYLSEIILTSAKGGDEPKSSNNDAETKSNNSNEGEYDVIYENCVLKSILFLGEMRNKEIPSFVSKDEDPHIKHCFFSHETLMFVKSI